VLNQWVYSGVGNVAPAPLIRTWAAAGRLLTIEAHKKSNAVICLVERIFAFPFAFLCKDPRIHDSAASSFTVNGIARARGSLNDNRAAASTSALEASRQALNP
jgi:hypothetical protein